MKICFWVIIALAILSSSCAKIFYTPDAFQIAGEHTSIAILPPVISISATKKVDAEAIKEQQRTESMNFQKEMYSWLLKRKMQGLITPEIQDIETTIAILSEAGHPEKKFTAEQICDILKVDGTIGSNYSLSKPMSQGAAVAMTVLLGVWGPTNEVNATLNIKNCSNVKLIWNYNHKFSGGLGSTPGKLVDRLMKRASKKMPYFKH